jgi:hypothetical protein
MNDEMRLLKDFGDSLQPPSAQPPAQLRRRVLTARRRPFARLGFRLAIAAVAVAVIGVPVLNSADDPAPPVIALPSASQRPVTALELLQHAAGYAETAPELIARPDQFVFTETVVVYQGLPLNGTPAVPGPRTLMRQWRPVDGRTAAHTEAKPMEGPDAGWGITPWGPARGEPRTLPAGDEAMYAYLYRDAGGDHEQALAEAANVLSLAQHSPSAQASVFAAVQRIPGVVVREETKDLMGRTGLGLAYSSDGNDTELVFDSGTYQYLGVNRKINWVPKISMTVQGDLTLHVVANEALVRVSIVDRVGEL